MDQPGTITRIIRALEGADPLRRDEAVRALWERFFADLTSHARRRLRGMKASVSLADEEDAASRAFSKVCRGIERGQLRLASRVDLTRVLRSATTREVFTLLERSRTAAGKTCTDSSLENVPDPSLSPDLLLLALDACQRLLGLLETDDLRQVALWKLVGHSNEAIAERLGRSASTVERTLSRIREIWRRKWGDAVPSCPARSGPRGGSSEVALARIGSPASELAIMSPDDEIRLLRELAGLA